MVVLCWLGPALEVAEAVAELRRLESRREAASVRSECAEHGVGTEAPLGEAPASLGQAAQHQAVEVRHRSRGRQAPARWIWNI